MKKIFDKYLLYYIHAANKTFFHSMRQCSPFISPDRNMLLTGNGFIICIEIYIYYSVHIIYMVFQIALWVRGEISRPHWGGGMMRNFAGEGIFY